MSYYTDDDFISECHSVSLEKMERIRAWFRQTTGASVRFDHSENCSEVLYENGLHAWLYHL